MRSGEVDQGETPRTDWEMDMGIDRSRPNGNGHRAGNEQPRVNGPLGHRPDNVNRPDGPEPDSGRPRGRHASRSLSIGLVTALLIAVGIGVASAGAVSSSSSGIEGVWEFSGGQIAIQPSAGGTFTGTVVAATKFAECVHPVPQQIWTEMKLQPDGSYWGLHQWYFSSSNCTLNPTLGPTAWRMLEGTDGSHYLRVCLSSPGTTQPTIAASGAPNSPAEYAAYHVTYGCYDSALTAPLPNPGAGSSGKAGSGVAGSKETLTFSPSNKKCLSLRLFKIHLLEPQYDPLKTVSITIGGRKIASVHKGDYVVAAIDLKGLPKGAFTIKIKAVTVLGNHLADSRTYHTCAKKKLKPHNKLKLGKEKK